MRSAPIALGIGVAWSGPIEHLTENFWTAAAHWFPGLLLLEAFATGASADTTSAHAVLVVGIYVTAAAAVAALIFQRRDLTA